jgi:hypothetical protein
MSPRPSGDVTITVKIPETSHRLLSVLCDGLAFTCVEDVVLQLIDHAQQGVYRPGSWERQWLTQVFCDDWVSRLKPGDPYGRPNCEGIFQQPKAREELERNRSLKEEAQ